MATTYDTSSLLVGDKIMLFITTEGATTLPIAYGTNCSIEITADTIDTSSKMSGNWKEYLTAQLGYTVSSESLLSFTAGHLSYTKLKELMVARQSVPFLMSMPSADGNFTNQKDYVKGNAVITSLTLNANNGEICNCSIQMQGTGALEDASAEE